MLLLIKSKLKILFIRFSSIGDIILASPAIRCAKLQIPEVEIHFLTKSNMEVVSENNPYIDKFHYYSGNLSDTIQELKSEKFDLVVDLHKNIRSFIIRLRLKVPFVSFRKLSIEKFLLTKFGINKMPDRHISLRSVDALKSLNVEYDGMGLDYFVNKEEVRNWRNKFQEVPQDYIVLVLGASYETKRMPIGKWLEWIDKMPLPIVLLGGGDCLKENDELMNSRRKNLISLVNKCSLNESAAIVRDSKLVASHDTGLLYMASAFGVPSLAIWGGTSPKLQVEPFYADSIKKRKYFNSIVEDLDCQPCSNYGTRKCPKGHFKCMLNQNIDQLVLNSMELLG